MSWSRVACSFEAILDVASRRTATCRIVREALVATQDQVAEAQQVVAEHARQHQETEAAAQRAYDDLAAALVLA